MTNEPLESFVNYRLSTDRDILQLPTSWNMDAILDNLKVGLDSVLVNNYCINTPDEKRRTKFFLIDNAMMMGICLRHFKELFQEDDYWKLKKLKEDYDECLKYYQYY